MKLRHFKIQAVTHAVLGAVSAGIGMYYLIEGSAFAGYIWFGTSLIWIAAIWFTVGTVWYASSTETYREVREFRESLDPRNSPF